MAVVKMVDGIKHWVDAQGRLIPLDKISELDRAKDALIMGVVPRFRELNTKLKNLRDWVYTEVAAYLEEVQKNYGGRGELPKSGANIRDFSGQFKLEIQIANVIEFDERLQIAKGLIDNCITRWGKNSNPSLVAVIMDVFRVDQKGKISVPRILGLRRLGLDDPEWVRAMDAITDAVMITHTKKYIRLYERNDEGGYDPIPLDMASL